MRFITALCCSALFLIGCSGGVPVANNARSSQQDIGVFGTHLTLNGNNWLPRSVVLQAFVAPLAYLQVNDTQAYNAQINYGPAEFAAINAYGADTIRFQVSQPSLDPQSPLYSAQYANALVTGMQQAREAGFIVMIMMQDESLSGEPDPHPLATAETVRDWDLLNPLFGTDRGVIYELYNEPEIVSNATDWDLWANGDTTGNSTIAPGAVGMQTLTTHLRSEGSKNVFIVDALGFAQNLSGVIPIIDPLDQMVYAVHPYPRGSSDESKWPSQFGIASQTLPVWADEWSAKAGGSLGLGQLPTYQVAVDLLNYCRSNNIAVGGGAFDIPGLLVQNVPGWTPTNYDNYSPSNTGDDAGALLEVLFRTDYSRPLTLADGLQ